MAGILLHDSISSGWGGDRREHSSRCFASIGMRLPGEFAPIWIHQRSKSRLDKITVLWYSTDTYMQESGMLRISLIVAESLNNRRPPRKPVYPSG